MRWSTAPAERRGTPDRGLVRLRGRRGGIPASTLVTHHPRAQPGGYPGAEVCRRHLCWWELRNLAIVPVDADLLVALTSAREQ